MYVLRNDTHYVVSFDPMENNSPDSRHAIQFPTIEVALAFDVYRRAVRDEAGDSTCANYAYLMPPKRCPTCAQNLPKTLTP